MLKGKKCPRVGLKVRANVNPASALLYSPGHAPTTGATGVVTTVPLPGGRKTCMNGPGGGLVYVKWDDGRTFGVSRYDIEKAKGGKGGLGMHDVLDQYKKCLRKCKKEQPASLVPCLDECNGVAPVAGLGGAKVWSICPECEASFKVKPGDPLPPHRAFRGTGQCPGSGKPGVAGLGGYIFVHGGKHANSDGYTMTFKDFDPEEQTFNNISEEKYYAIRNKEFKSLDALRRATLGGFKGLGCPPTEPTACPTCGGTDSPLLFTTVLGWECQACRQYRLKHHTKPPRRV